jgi:hypothetical protein
MKLLIMQPPVTLSPFGPNILLNILFSNTLSLLIGSSMLLEFGTKMFPAKFQGYICITVLSALSS